MPGYVHAVDPIFSQTSGSTTSLHRGKRAEVVADVIEVVVVVVITVVVDVVSVGTSPSQARHLCGHIK